jgi:alpha-1,3-mannosylglycoprotein beta-1,4-N-acetylglucosaminyltransferase A/B
MDRVKWRSKQNLDYAYLMMYSVRRGRFYLQLEDDVLTVPNFASTILDFLGARNDDWFDVHFFVGGFIGKLFR